MLKNLLKLSCAAVILLAGVAHASVQANSAGWEKYGELTFRVAERTGVPVMDLVALTSMESGYNAKVCNGEGTSACGLGAMTSRTYYTMVKRYGKQVGVKPGTSRKNARANLLMTAMYWQENRQILSNKLGRKVSREEAYMAHLLGPAGAIKVIKASGNRAAWKVAGIDPSKNKKFFMKGSKRTGYKARTVSEFKAYVSAEMSRHANSYREHATLTAFSYSYQLPNV
jgi:hypothetical protein